MEIKSINQLVLVWRDSTVFCIHTRITCVVSSYFSWPSYLITSPNNTKPQWNDDGKHLRDKNPIRQHVTCNISHRCIEHPIWNVQWKPFTQKTFIETIILLNFQPICIILIEFSRINTKILCLLTDIFIKSHKNLRIQIIPRDSNDEPVPFTNITQPHSGSLSIVVWFQLRKWQKIPLHTHITARFAM